MRPGGRAAAAVVLATIGLAAIGLAGPARGQGTEPAFDTAILQGLDKVTARVITIDARVGVPVRFGALEIIARACKKRRPEDQPESAAFLDIWELRPDQPALGLFRGWMFASSPALSAMEHPVYDVWVLDCRNAVPR
ncbi:DUF2155 domain-containing protein [Magnetospirillum sp. SS-4]|uniref:DUF2155 domain-containing protein n=1 Tax=Magnetospirillum sp. SS-4 TaxID=2681465 RepID=UPI001382161A|nr:DUF2155 domain-containing protein [Magnetospirillum sp. SS-4]CAA7617475.1 conserved exported hypothetical protein [Magnetospirillum sp. SS-4]